MKDMKLGDKIEVTLQSDKGSVKEKGTALRLANRGKLLVVRLLNGWKTSIRLTK